MAKKKNRPIKRKEISNHNVPKMDLTETSQKHKLTKNEQLTLTMSILALVVSVTQLVFSLPFILNKIYKPNVVVKVFKPFEKNSKIISNFQIINNGNKFAEGLVTSFLCNLNDSILYSPQGGYEMSRKISAAGTMKEITLKADHFIPEAEVSVTIYSDTLDIRKIAIEMNIKSTNLIKTLSPPYVSQIRYNDGSGKIEAEY